METYLYHPKEQYCWQVQVERKENGRWEDYGSHFFQSKEGVSRFMIALMKGSKDPKASITHFTPIGCDNFKVGEWNGWENEIDAYDLLKSKTIRAASRFRIIEP